MFAGAFVGLDWQGDDTVYGEVVVRDGVRYITHPPICILSNLDFASQSFSGNGTVWSPWLIENYEINGTGYSYGIYIKDSTDFFIIQGCFIHHIDTYGPIGDACGIYLENVVNGCIRNNNILNNAYCGIYLSGQNQNNKIENNTIEYNNEAIFVGASDNNYIAHNNISYNSVAGIEIYFESNFNVICGNTLNNNMFGCYIWDADNMVYNNYFINNTNQAYDGSNYYWDNGYPSGGNYWSDYSGVDIYCGPNQDQIGGDGYGDAPYSNIGGWTNSEDRYPLTSMTPWTYPVIALISPTNNSYFPNGTIIDFDVWDKNDDIIDVSQSINGGANTSFYPPYDIETTGWADGDYNIQIYTADSFMHENAHWYHFTIDSTAPVADAGLNQIINEGQSVTFDGSGSTDNYGIVNYTWTSSEYIDEGFDSGVPPLGWSKQDLTNSWSQQNTNLAGGTAPEVQFKWTNLVNTWRLYSGPIDTTGMTELYLQFRHYFKDLVPGVTMKVQTSSNGVTWQDTGWYINSGSGNVGPCLESFAITTSDVGSSTFRVAFTVQGNAYQMQYWYIDNVLLNYPKTLYGINPTWTFNTPGVYNVTLNVTDDAGNGDLDWVEITVRDITPPTITLNSPVNNSKVQAGTILDFDVMDLFIDSVHYSINGGSDINFQEPFDINTNGWTSGGYEIVVQANDTAGNTLVKLFTFTIDSIAPMANAGPDQTVGVGTVVNFDGSSSTDNEGIVIYAWAFNDGSLRTIYSINPTYIFNMPGLYNVTLTVTDAAGNWDIDWVEITVNDVTDPIADAGPDQIVDEDTVVTLDGSNSTDNVGIVNYTWTFDEGDLKNLYGVSPNYIFNTPGLYNITMNVSDVAGNRDIDWVEITVIDITHPVITLNSPANNSMVPAGTILKFDVADLFLSNVEYTINGGPSINFSAPYNIDTSGWSDGTYIIDIYANDTASNNATESYTFTIDSTAPAADAGSDQVVDEDTPVFFDGSGSTDNTGIVNYTWTFEDSGQIALFYVNQNYIFNTPGLYNVTLNVTDAAGNWHVDWVWITVNDVTDPMADAGPDQIVDEDTTVTFDGSGSTDNVEVVNYTWTFEDGGLIILYDVNPNYTFNTPGLYNVTLNVTDLAGNGHVSWVWITVNDITDPMANAGLDQIVDEDTTVTFDGSSSIDNVEVVNFIWTFEDGGTIIVYGMRPNYTFNTPGLYNVTLNVTDAAGNWHVDWVWITVNDVTPPTIMLLSPMNNSAILPGTLLNFSVSDLYLNIVNYSINGGPVITFSEPYDIDISGWAEGIYVITISANDTAGNSAVRILTFTIDATPPDSSVVPISNYWRTDAFSVEATVNDTNGIENVTLWYRFSPDNAIWGPWKPFRTDLFEPWWWNFNFPDGDGCYEFYSIANDTAGNIEPSPASADARCAYDATAPSAVTGPDIAAVEGSIVTLNGSASTDNIGITNYTWTFAFNGSTITLFGVSPDFNFTLVGNYTVMLRVKDAAGNSNTDTMNVTVSDLDSDGDGVPDHEDVFPDNPDEWTDSDGDGVGDNSDAFPDDPDEWADTDSDGIGDNSDAFPTDPAASEDSDGDGYPDAWNPGMGANDSTTGLALDAFPDDPDRWAEETDDDTTSEQDNLLTKLWWLWIIIILAIIGLLMVLRRRQKPPIEVAETTVPQALQTEPCLKCGFDIEKGGSCPFCAPESAPEPVPEPEPPKPEPPKSGLNNDEKLARIEKAYMEGQMSEEQYLRNKEKFSK